MRILYHIPLSPLCRKIRVALKEKELPAELIVEYPWETRAELQSINPAGEMPVLVDEDGLVIRGHYAIGEYLDEMYPYKPLMGQNLADRSEIRRLMDWFDTRFYSEVSRPLLHEKMFKKFMEQGGPDSRAIRQCKELLHYHLAYITNLLEDRHGLAGDSVSLADIAAAAHLSSLDYLGDVPWDEYPKVREWYSLMKSRPSFRPLLSDRVAAFRPPVHYENPDF